MVNINSSITWEYFQLEVTDNLTTEIELAGLYFSHIIKIWTDSRILQGSFRILMVVRWCSSSPSIMFVFKAGGRRDSLHLLLWPFYEKCKSSSRTFNRLSSRLNRLLVSHWPELFFHSVPNSFKEGWKREFSFSSLYRGSRHKISSLGVDVGWSNE